MLTSLVEISVLIENTLNINESSRSANHTNPLKNSDVNHRDTLTHMVVATASYACANYSLIYITTEKSGTRAHLNHYDAQEHGRTFITMIC